MATEQETWGEREQLEQQLERFRLDRRYARHKADYWAENIYQCDERIREVKRQLRELDDET